MGKICVQASRHAQLVCSVYAYFSYSPQVFVCISQPHPLITFPEEKSKSSNIYIKFFMIIYLIYMSLYVGTQYTHACKEIIVVVLRKKSELAGDDV